MAQEVKIIGISNAQALAGYKLPEGWTIVQAEYIFDHVFLVIKRTV